MALFSSSLIGLDIGSSSIKMVQLKPSGKGYALVSFAVQEISDEAVEDIWFARCFVRSLFRHDVRILRHLCPARHCPTARIARNGALPLVRRMLIGRDGALVGVRIIASQ